MKGQVDLEDLILMPVFVISGLIGLGLIGSFSIVGIDPSAALLELPGGTAFSIANLLSIVTFAAAVATNEWEAGPWGAINLYLVVATFLLILAPPLMPLISELLSNQVAAGFAFVIQTAGYSAVSYVG